MSVTIAHLVKEKHSSQPVGWALQAGHISPSSTKKDGWPLVAAFFH